MNLERYQKIEKYLQDLTAINFRLNDSKDVFFTKDYNFQDRKQGPYSLEKLTEFGVFLNPPPSIYNESDSFGKQHLQYMLRIDNIDLSALEEVYAKEIAFRERYENIAQKLSVLAGKEGAFVYNPQRFVIRHSYNDYAHSIPQEREHTFQNKIIPSILKEGAPILACAGYTEEGQKKNIFLISTWGESYIEKKTIDLYVDDSKLDLAYEEEIRRTDKTNAEKILSPNTYLQKSREPISLKIQADFQDYTPKFLGEITEFAFEYHPGREAYIATYEEGERPKRGTEMLAELKAKGVITDYTNLQSSCR